MQDRVDDSNRPIELERTEARQGVRGLPVLYVLVAGLALALICWAIVQYAVR